MKPQAQGVAPKVPVPDGESVRDFISMAVHDLREPLRAIRLGTQILSNTGEIDPAETTRGTRYVEEGVDRMEMLIQDIAEYCYAEVRELNPHETDLESILVEAKKELHGDLKGCGAVITHDPLPAVWGNAASLGCVFRCLISNACRFRGAAPPSIHVSVERQRAEWIISVKDNGQGFDAAYRERIFRPFERLNGRQYPGSGLGLSLAKRIIEQHGGNIWAESRLGEGTTIRFSLPFAG